MGNKDRIRDLEIQAEGHQGAITDLRRTQRQLQDELNDTRRDLRREITLREDLQKLVTRQLGPRADCIIVDGPHRWTGIDLGAFDVRMTKQSLERRRRKARRERHEHAKRLRSERVDRLINKVRLAQTHVCGQTDDAFLATLLAEMSQRCYQRAVLGTSRGLPLSW